MRLPFCYPRYFLVAALLLGIVGILPVIIHLHFGIDLFLEDSDPIRFFDPERDYLLNKDPGPTDSTTLDLFGQDAGEELKGPEENVHQNSESRDTVNRVKDGQSDNDGNTGTHENNVTIATTEEMSELSDQGTLEEDAERLYTLGGTKERIWEMEDQLIMAKAYLDFVPKANNTLLRQELKLRTRDIEKALGQANKSSDFSMSALQTIRAMEATLSKAHRAYPDCSERAYKIRSSLEKKEEELRTVQNELLYLVHVASTSLPKGIQCLSLRLTSEYFTSNPKDHKLLVDRHKVQKPYLHHYAVFSDNVLACAVVVNSTISSSQEPEKIVFHVVTDSLNFPAMTMWFLLNPPTPATIDILVWDNYEQLAANFSPTDELVGIRDPAYTSTVNRLQFFLPNLFPFLHKILVLDHDVVVQRDLSWLWRINMEGKVTCAVKMCNHQLEDLLDFTDPILSSSFDPKACVLAFGMNMFDLNEWRKQGLTASYGNWIQKGITRKFRTGEGWPLAQLVFYNHTAYLNGGWHLLGLGNDMNVRREEIKKAAVIHYSGTRKPWIDSAIREYKNFWDKYLNYNNPSLQKCHVHNN
uniref:Hexosyltransferase n=1 Tax=Ananas comosus var. bracteatus TaxID=296719 RepID=A0A6V7QRT6_ANACO